MVISIKNIAIYCGSKSGVDDRFLLEAKALGTMLAEKNVTIIYGGAECGLMGALADSCIAAGGRVVGVIPDAINNEVGHSGLEKLYIEKDMHARKQKMFDLADAFIALPGGFGTFEELFEVLTWGQLGFHKKPVGILNTANYYDGFVSFIDHSVTQGFIKQKHRDMLLSSSDITSLLEMIQSYNPSFKDKWS